MLQVAGNSTFIYRSTHVNQSLCSLSGDKNILTLITKRKQYSNHKTKPATLEADDEDGRVVICIGKSRNRH